MASAKASDAQPFGFHNSGSLSCGQPCKLETITSVVHRLWTNSAAGLAFWFIVVWRFWFAGLRWCRLATWRLRGISGGNTNWRLGSGFLRIRVSEDFTGGFGDHDLLLYEAEKLFEGEFVHFVIVLNKCCFRCAHLFGPIDG